MSEDLPDDNGGSEERKRETKDVPRRKFLKGLVAAGAAGVVVGYLAPHVQAAPSTELVFQDDFIQFKALAADPSPVPQGGLWYRSDQAAFYASPDAVSGVVPVIFSAGVSTLGNTSGNTTVQPGQLVLQGGNNITLSEITGASSKMTVIISGGAGGGGGIAASAGTQSVSTGTVLFADSNGLSFGMSASSRITVSYTQETTPPIGIAVKDVGSAGSTGTITRFAPEDHAHRGLNQFQITGNTSNTSNLVYGSLWLAGGNNITLSQVSGVGAATVTISAGAGGGGGIAASAGTQSVSTGTVLWADSNGISFGMSASTAITASYTRPVASNALQDVGTVTGSGTNTSRFAADDHLHRGIRAYQVQAILSTFFGDVVFSASNLLTISTGGNSTAGTVIYHNLLSSATTASRVDSANAIGAMASRVALEAHQHAGLWQISVGGNTSGGNTSAGPGSFMLAGGPNITLSGATAAGGMTLSVSAAAAVPTVLMMDNAPAGASGGLAQTLVDASMIVFPFDAKQEVFPGNMTVKTVLLDLSGSVSSSSFSYSASLGIFTLNNSTQLSRVFSASTNWGNAAAMSNSNSFGGYKFVTIHSSLFDVQPTFSQTHYWGALWIRSSNAQTYTIIGGQNLATGQRSGTMGAGSSTAGGWRPFSGVFSVSFSTAMPSAIAASDINDSHGAGGFIPRIRLEATVSSF